MDDGLATEEPSYGFVPGGELYLVWISDVSECFDRLTADTRRTASQSVDAALEVHTSPAWPHPTDPEYLTAAAGSIQEPSHRHRK